ncbi:hypothetical protein MRX96_025869 [Rhipicephalus microplus]
MSAFQLVMYADTAEKLEAATAELKALQHEASVSRVRRFLRRQEDCVAAHQLQYKRLLSRMPKDAAEAIQVVGPGQYIVPSATHPSFSYEVYATHPSFSYGLCTCLFGKQGAFCKHQALVQKKYGGLFPNAPALSTDDRYQLGQLAPGEKCPPRIFFEPFQEEEPSSSARTTEALLGVGQGLQGGSKRVPTGRPAVEPAAKRAKKRPHCLSHSIEKNVPGARLH